LNYLGDIKQSKEVLQGKEDLANLVKEFYQDENGSTKEQREHIAALLGRQIENCLSPVAKLKVDNKELLFKD